MEWLVVAVLCMVIYFVTIWFVRKQTIGGFGERHVFITGCDTGFGHMLALRLDEMGFQVIAGCLTEKGEDELRKNGSRRLATVRVDVRSQESIQRARENVEAKLPRGKGLWALVNNAGIAGSIGPAEWMRTQDYLDTFAVNLFGVTETTRLFLPLVRQGKGRVVVMSSANGAVTIPYFVPYTISKYAVEVFADSLRPEARKYGVTVHVIQPGMFNTNIRRTEPIADGVRTSFNRLEPEVRSYYGEEFLADFLRQIETSPKAPSGLNKVVDAYVHAIAATFPMARYRVGLDSKIVWRLLAWLPEWLTDVLYCFFLPTPRGAR